MNSSGTSTQWSGQRNNGSVWLTCLVLCLLAGFLAYAMGFLKFSNPGLVGLAEQHYFIKKTIPIKLIKKSEEDINEEYLKLLLEEKSDD